MVQAVSSESLSSLYQKLMDSLGQTSNSSSSSAISNIAGNNHETSLGSIEDRFLNFLQKGIEKVDKNQDKEVSFDEVKDFVDEKIEDGVEKVANFVSDNLKNFVSNADSPFNGLAEKFNFNNLSESFSNTVLNAYKNQNLLANIANNAVSALF